MKRMNEINDKEYLNNIANAIENNMVDNKITLTFEHAEILVDRLRKIASKVD